MAIEWLSALLGGGAKGVLEGVGSLAKDLRAAITGQEPLSAEQKAELLLKAQAMEQAAEAAAMEFDVVQMGGQIELNKLEAQQGLFKGGWRPFCGWVCGLGLAYTFLLRPILPWVVATLRGQPLLLMPELDMGTLLTLLGGMLGLGGMRSLERIKGMGKV